MLRRILDNYFSWYSANSLRARTLKQYKTPLGIDLGA